MKTRPVVAVVGTSVLVLCVSGSAVAQAVLARQRCQTMFQGTPIEGQIQIERWSYHDTHRIYGQFSNPAGTLIEMEVFTNQPGGVGGMWFNHARHRETRIYLQRVGGGFVVRTEDGAAAQFACR